MIWYKNNDENVVISTRIRLARNLEKYPFPNMMSKSACDNAKKEIIDSILKSNSTLSKEFNVYDMQDVTDIDKKLLYEKHLISPDMVNKENSAVLVGKDEDMSIMLMEEDHIRIQVIYGGEKLDEAYKTASMIDDVIDEHLKYAYDKDFGYLTSCPTNTGTGLRASVMMHLPALTMTDNIQRVIREASNLGIAVRGLYGEGSKAYGSLYQISNQVTLGLSEEEVIEKVKNIVNQIVELEKEARGKIYENNKYTVCDKVYRSYGILKNAQLMSSTEAKTLISDVIMGKNMGIISEVKANLIELMVTTEPTFIELGEKKRLSPEERDIKRAKIIRDNL